MQEIMFKNIWQSYKKLYYGLVTLLLSFIYGSLVINGQYYMYIDIGADTYSHSWPYYTWFAEQIKNGQSLFWSFNLGLGGNMISSLSGLMDPFNLILFLFPKQLFPLGILVTTIVKYYVLATIAYAYFKKIGFNGFALVVSSLCYTFCGWFVSWGQHYSFATVFVLFTFILYSFEYYIYSNKKILLIISIVLLAVHSLYFFYMVSIFFLIYSIFRYFTIDKKNRIVFYKYFLKLFSIYICGIGLSSVVFIPQIFVLLNSDRVSGAIIPSLNILDFKNYIVILSRIVSSSLLGVNSEFGYYGIKNFYEDSFLSTSVIVFFLLPILFTKKIRSKLIINIFLICVFLLIFQNFSNPLFNAFSSRTTRWFFIFIPIICIGIAYSITFLQNIDDLRDYQYNFLFGFSIGFFIIFILAKYYIKILHNPVNDIIISSALIISSIIFILLLILFLIKIPKYIFNSLLLIVILFDLGYQGYLIVNKRSTISADGSNFYVPYFDDSVELIETLKIKDKSFYRIAKNYSHIDLADPLIQSYNGEKLYNSAIPSTIWKLQSQFQIPVMQSNYFYGFGQNEMLRGIMCGKYLISNSMEQRYGYVQIDSFDNMRTFKNSNSLPLGIIYSNYIDTTIFNNMNLVEKTYSIYSGFSTEDHDLINMYTNSTSQIQENFEIYSNNIPIKYEIINNSIIIVPQDNIEGIKVLSFVAEINNNIFSTMYVYSIGERNEEIITPIPFKLNNINNIHEIFISTNNIDKIIFSFPFELNIDNINFKLCNMDYIQEKINIYKQSSMNIVSHSSNTIIGNVKSENDGLLFLAIPYDKGWSAKVNGEKKPIYLINTAFMGINITSGENDIILEYNVPGMKIGIIISIITFLLLIFYIIVKKYRFLNILIKEIK